MLRASVVLALLPLVVNGMTVTLYGSQQSRSPLVNWYMIEQKIDFKMANPRPSDHPFGQIPFLTDEDGVEVFESGACLLYLADKYQSSSAAERATWTKWVMWANSELDGLCRISRIVEALYTQITFDENPDDQTDYMPVTVIEGMNHMQFASGEPPR